MGRVEKIGGCTLYLGDALDIIESLRPMDAQLAMSERGMCGEESIVSGIFSDPPYGISYKSGHATDALWGKARAINSDENTMARDFVVAWSAGIPTLMFGSWKAPRPVGTKMVLIWDKGGALGMGDLSLPWKPDHEEIYVLGRGFCGARDSGSVLRCPPVQSMAKNGRVHPNQKPVDLAVSLCRKIPGVILDPFMGSGTTLVACAKLGRKGIGIELDPDYFEIACRRVEEAYKQPDMFIERPKPAEQEAMTFDEANP